MNSKKQSDLQKVLADLRSSTDRNVIYKNLIKIRVDHIKTNEDVRLLVELDAIPMLVSFLAKPQENILDVVLSCLGNITCMSKEAATKALESSVLSSINAILSSVASTSIKTRCLRLLGNIGQYIRASNLPLESLFRNVLSSVCNEFDEILASENFNANVNTFVMLIRVVRILWKHKNAANTFIFRGVVKKIMGIFLKCFELPSIPEEELIPNRMIGETVILKRATSPDRIVTKEKFLNMLRDIENNKTDIIGYEPVRDPTSNTSRDCTVIDKKEVKSLMNGILKFLELFSTNCNVSVVSQIFSNPVANECLCSLINTEHNSLILKLFSALVTYPITKQVLTAHDVVTKLTKSVVDSEVSGIDLTYCIKILCSLTEDACNRGKVRRSGIFKILIDICRHSKNDEELKMILVAFYQFRFDPLGLDCLLKEGVIVMIIKLLEQQLKQKEFKLIHKPVPEEQKEIRKSKRKKDSEENLLPKSKTVRSSPSQASPEVLGYLNPFSTSNVYSSPFLRSPSPSYYDPGSPASSSGYSSGNIQDSPNYDLQYSPVCSDAEDESEMHEETKQKEQTNTCEKPEIFDISTLMYDENSMESMPSDDETAVKKLNETSNEDVPTESGSDLIDNALKLLLELSKRNTNAKDFVSSSTLDTLLLVYSSVSEAQCNIVQILKKILRHVHNFISILRQNFIFKLYESRRLENCPDSCPSCATMEDDVKSLLDSFGISGGSGYGIGELTHLLLKGEKQMQIQAAIMTLYLIKCPKSLYTLLFVHNALDIVLNLIFTDSENNYANYASSGISVMANNLNIKILTENTIIMEQIVSFDEEQETVDDACEDCVTFIAANDEEIKCSRAVLMSASEFFDTMFKSDFREAQESTVLLKNISSTGLKYFLRLVADFSKHTDLPWCITKNMVAILEAYGLSKVYLLGELEAALVQTVKKTINHKNAIDVFEWSLNNYDNELLATSINYYLASGNITGREKTIMLNEAYTSSFKEQWLQRVKDTVSLNCNFGE